jgi:hypothetical protein
MIDLLWRLRASLGDLSTLVASAKTGIEGRRALMLAKDLVEFRPPTEKPIGRIF